MKIRQANNKGPWAISRDVYERVVDTEKGTELFPSYVDGVHVLGGRSAEDESLDLIERTPGCRLDHATKSCLRMGRNSQHQSQL